MLFRKKLTEEERTLTEDRKKLYVAIMSYFMTVYEAYLGPKWEQNPST